MPAWWSAYQSVLCHISKVWLLKVLELHPNFLLLRFICRIWKNFNFGVKCHVHVHINICSTKLKMAICCSGPGIHLPIQIQSGSRSLLTKIFLDIDYLWWPLQAWVNKTIALGAPVTLCEGFASKQAMFMCLVMLLLWLQLCNLSKLLGFICCY